MHRECHIISYMIGVCMVGVISLTSLNGNNAFLLSHELPCEYLDSVNITDGELQKDGSITHNNIRYQKHQYTKINYILENGEKRIAVEPYIRGCLCTQKPCIRLCCPAGNIYDPTLTEGKKCREDKAASKIEANILNEKNQVQKVVLDQNFAYVDDRACPKFYMAGTNYNISNLGTVIYESKSVAHKGYCLMALLDGNDAVELNLVMCFSTADQIKTRYRILPYTYLLSVPFILATIFVYICLPELRNLHGKCLLCYLIGLLIGYIFMALIQLNGSNYVEPSICKSIGYIIYFSFLSAFLWLSVVSFDIWWNFRTTSSFLTYSESKRFILYMIYAWGLASLFALTVFIFDTAPSISDNIKPGVGVESCFLKTSRTSRLLYFYMPLCIVWAINIVFFMLTALKIRNVQQDLKKVTSKEESSRHQSKFNRDKENYTLYLRLFIVMGVTWSLEGLSFFISEHSNYFLISDICNTIQGVLIFVLFVLKTRVLRLIKKRWQGCFGKATTNGSVATNSTSATYAPQNVLNQITSPNDKSKGSC